MKHFKKRNKTVKQFSKKMIEDTRPLLWIITIGGLLLAFYCVYSKFSGSLPWVAGMVSAVWASKGTVESFYLNMSKADHSVNGITFETAKSQNFVEKNYEEQI